LNPHAEAQVPKTCVSAISPLPRIERIAPLDTGED
jgi:hypothetical protein